jgi:hypothetical protein
MWRVYNTVFGAPNDVTVAEVPFGSKKDRQRER